MHLIVLQRGHDIAMAGLIIRNASNFDHNLFVSYKTSHFIPVIELRLKVSILGDGRGGE